MLNSHKLGAIATNLGQIQSLCTYHFFLFLSRIMSKSTISEPLILLHIITIFILRCEISLPNTCNPKDPDPFFNSFTTKKQTTKFSSANFQKLLSPSYIMLRIQRLDGKQCRIDEVAHYEPPHQDLHCLQIQLFSSLVIKKLRWILFWKSSHSL